MTKKIILFFAFWATCTLLNAQIKAYEYSSNNFNEAKIEEILKESRKTGTPEWEIQKLRQHLYERLEKQKQRLAAAADNEKNLSPPPSPMIACQPDCSNLGFESGGTTGWTLTSGDINLVNLPCNTCATNAGALYAMSTASNSGAMWTNGVDNCSGQPAVAPGGGVYSIALNDMSTGGKMQEIQQKYNVTATNNVLTYQYLAILENPGHPTNQQPYFFSQVLDGSGNAIACTYYLQAADAAAVGWTNCSATGGCSDAQYKGWITVTLDMTSYIGQCVTLQFIVSDCNQGGHYGYAYIDASCDQIQANNIVTICPGTTQLCGPSGFNTYSWSGPVTGNTMCLNTGTPGSYTLVTTGQCPAPTRFYTVNVSPTPTVNFTYTVTPCSFVVPFTDQTTISGGASITNYSWTFGDGGSSTAQNPSHTYATTGTFNVALTCTSSAGCTGTYSTTVTIGTGPTAAFSASTVCPGNPTVFTNTSTGATGYSWDFGDPPSGAANTSTATNPSHTYPAAGNYNVVLTATGTGTCVATKTVTVVVTPVPTATISAPKVCLGAATVFTSTITSGNTYNWNYGDGSAPAAGTATPSHTYTLAGSYPVTVTVTSAGSCTTTATTTVVVNPVPTASFTVGAVCQGTGSVFNNTSTLDSACAWNFGGAGNPASATSNCTPTFTYTSAGNFPVTLTVTAAGGCTATATGTAVVNTFPVLGFTANHPCDGSPVIFTNTTTNQAAISNWHWDFGDGGDTSNVASPTFTYTAPAGFSAANCYTVVLTATATTGCSGTHDTVVYVHNNPFAYFNAWEACLGTPSEFVDSSFVQNPPCLNDQIVSWSYDFGDGLPPTLYTSATMPDTIKYTYAACGPYNITATVTTNNGCTFSNTLTGDTVFCLPTVVGPLDFSVCPGAPTPVQTFTTTCTNGGTPYSQWGQFTDVTGAPASYAFGNPNFDVVPSYNAINPNLTCNLLTDTVFAVAVSGVGCVGNATYYLANVYPTPTVTPVSDVTVCTNASVPATNFTGCPAPTETFSWTTTTTPAGNTIGLAASGGGNIASFPGQNTTDMPIVTEVDVTPWANGCSGPMTTFSITVNPIPTMTVTSPAPYCPGAVISSADYNITTDPAIPGVTYTWTATNTANTGMPAGPLTGAAPNAPYNAPANNTQNNVTSVITYTPSLAGCIGLPVTETVTIKPTPTMVAMTDQYWCPAANTNPVPFSTTPAATGTSVVTYTYSYNAGGGVPATGNLNPFPSLVTSNSGLTTLTTAVTVTPTLNGCVGPPSGFNIYVYPNPIAHFSATTKVCDGQPMGFTDLSKPNTGSITVNTWAWDMNSDGSIDVSSQNPNYTYPLGSAGTNTVTLYVGTSSAPSCTAQVTEPVYINPNPVADFVGDSLKSCPTLLTHFTNLTTVLTPSTGISYNWTFGNGNVSTAITPPAQTYSNSSATQSAYYNVTLTATTDSGCVNTKTKTKYIQVYPRPIANFSWGPIGAGIDEPTITFVNEAIGAGPYTPQTFGPHGVQYYLDDIYAANPNMNTVYGDNAIGSSFIHVYEHYDTATYYVTQWVINTLGCKDTITKPVHIGPNFTFYIPNAFTPNADGVNEGFKGLGVGIDNTTYNLWVFDRWGLMVFYADDIDKAWDGHLRGNEGKPVLQEDVYVWKVKFNDFTGKRHEYHGTVTLLK